MNTIVKIYREEENKDLILDESSRKKYNALMDELGIEKPKPDSISPPVYQPLNDFTDNCLKALCPNESEYNNYNKSTIPVEVLEVISYCVENKVFDKMKIYSDTTEPDPVLVGCNYTSEDDRKNGYEWKMNKFLVARWGDCAYELNQLVDMAKEKVKSKIEGSVAELKGKFLSFELNPDATTEEAIKSNNSNPFTGNLLIRA